MCGIFGVTKDKNAPQTILSGLKRLEYRGYDSWGIVVKGKSRLNLEKHTGKISGSKTVLDQSDFGIGHTRWATHGGVTDANAHPHLDCTGHLAVVHNGIIDNWQELQKKIKGHKLKSQTDSEIAAHLIEKELTKKNDLFTAFTKVFSQIHGYNALIAIHQDFPYLVAGKTGSPLVIGIKKGNNLIASDVSSLLPITQDVVFLEDGQLAKVSADKVEIYSTKTNKKIPLKISHISWSAKEADKGKFPHFMLKEIREQPKIISEIKKSKTYEVDHLAKQIKTADSTFVVACGTAAYAALSGQYFFSRIAKHQINPAIGSEFFYHSDFLGPKSLCIALSQSGETIDTLQSVQHAKHKKAKVVSLVNVPGSSLSRLSDQTILLDAGPEKAVASTKAFLAKVTLLLLTAYTLSGERQKAISDLSKAEKAIKDLFASEYTKRLKKLVNAIYKKEDLFVLGRGQSYPSALEIALKIKEVSYIHAEGLPAGELKHGPIALIEKGTPCIILDPGDETSSDVLSSAMEVKARGSYVIGISIKDNPVFDSWLPIKKAGEATVFPMIVVGQLLAYYLALARGFDPDMPRNLAKSVTVK